MSYDPYHFDDDREPRYPYQDFYEGGRPPRRRGGWWIFLIVAVVMAGLLGAAAMLSRYSIEVRQGGDGLSFSIRERENAEAEPDVPPQHTVEDEPALLQPNAAVGVGAELAVTDAPRDMPETLLDEGGMSLQEIYKKVLPSVVSITTTLRSGGATGTGIIMSVDGYIITNEHVVEDAVAIEILTSDDRVFSAALVGSDDTSDLAVLKVEADDLAAAEFGNSGQMEVGDSVVAIGDPLGKELRGTMTDGIISAINRDLVVNGRAMTLMQTNAALNNGNSGGPLINAYGQVIGINTMKMSSYYSGASVEGLGFAIPISTAKPIVDELIAQGYVSGRPAIGISGKQLPQAVRAYYRLPDGVYVESVEPGSDAEAQGIRSGDTITAIEGEAVASMEALNLVKNRYEAGDAVTLTVYRAGEYYEVRVRLMDAATM